MFTGHHYKVLQFLYWTRRDIYMLVGIGIVPVFLYACCGLTWISIPWVPVALIGTACAFIVGFKNTQTYNRLWEARQIWGAIVNSSRSFGIMARDYLNDTDASRELIYRHCAWLTALRYQLREHRSWENWRKPYYIEYLKNYKVPEWNNDLTEQLATYISAEELQYLLPKKNRATQLIALQSKQLKSLKESGKLDALNYVEIENMLVNLYDQQGKCERIKNYPYPRQFASINLYFIWLLVIFLPFGLLNEFEKMGEHFVWLTVPFSVIVSWVFISMEKVGEATENPFEGGANDIPMASMARAIEIDLRDMLDEKDLPAAIVPVKDIVM